MYSFVIWLGIVLLLTTGLLLLWSLVKQRVRFDRESKELGRELLRMEALFAWHPEDRDFAALGRVAERCYRTARDKGWWDGFTTTRQVAAGSASPVKIALELSADQIAARLCLIHSEVSEALEDVRTGDMTTMKSVLVDTYRPEAPEGKRFDEKPVGFPTELADIVIRVFDLASHMGIDIGKEMARKMLYNTTRPHRHGGKAL